MPLKIEFSHEFIGIVLSKLKNYVHTKGATAIDDKSNVHCIDGNVSP